MDERSLVFPSSFIFQGSSLNDRIRQSIIDLKFDDDIPVSEVLQVYQQAIDLLQQDTPELTKSNATVLIETIIQHYPKDTIQFYQKICDLAQTYPYFVYLAARIALSSKSDKVEYELPIDPSSLLNNVIDIFVPQILNNASQDIKYGEGTINSGLAVNILLAIFNFLPIQESRVTFLNKLLLNGGNTQQKTNIILSIINSPFYEQLDPQFLVNPQLFLKANDEICLKLLNILTTESLGKIFPRIQDNLIERNNSDILTKLLSKCMEADKEDISIKLDSQSIVNILVALKIENFSPEVIKFLDQYSFEFPEEFEQSLPTDFKYENLVFIAKHSKDPSKCLESDQIENFIKTKNEEDISIIISKLTHPIFQNYEFWLELLKKNQDALLPRSFSQCYINNVQAPGASLAKLMTDIIPPTNRAVSFYFGVFSCGRDTFFEEYNEHADSDMLLILPSVPPMDFWSLAPNVDVINSYALLIEERAPLYYHGRAAYQIIKNVGCDAEIQMMEQTEESDNEIVNFLNTSYKDIYEMFENNELSMNALSLISAAEVIFANCYVNYKVPKLIDLEQQYTIPLFAIIFKMLELNHFGLRDRCRVLNNFLTSYLFNIASQQQIPPLIPEGNMSNLMKTSLHSFLNTCIEYAPYFLIHSKATEKSIIFFKLLTNSQSLLNDEQLSLDILTFFLIITNFPESNPEIADRELNVNQECAGLFNSYIGSCSKILLPLYLRNTHSFLPKYRRKLNIKIFEFVFIRDLNDLIASSLTFDLVLFLNEVLSEIPDDINPPNKEVIGQILKKEIDDKNYENINILVDYLSKFKVVELLVDLINIEGLPSELKIGLYSSLAQSDIQALRSVISVEDFQSMLDPEKLATDDKKDILNQIGSCFILEQHSVYNFILMRFQSESLKATLNISTILKDYSSLAELYSDSFYPALHAVFQVIPNTKMLIARCEQKTNEYQPSEYTKLLLNFYVKNIEVLPYLKTLDDILPDFPFLVNLLDYNELMEALLKLFNNYEVYYSNKENMEAFQLAMRATNLLARVSVVTKFADFFFPYFFQKISELTPYQVLPMLLILNGYLNFNYIQHVIISLMIKHCWTYSASVLLSNIPEEASEFNEIYVKLLLQLTSDYLDSLKKLSVSSAASAESIIEMETPFSTNFDNMICVTDRIGNLFTPLGSRSNAEQEIIQAITQNNLRIIKTKRNNNLDTIQAKFSSTVPEMEKIGNLPSSVDDAAFEQLPYQYQSSILYSMIPQYPRKLTPSMIRYLAHQPTWIYCWLNRPTSNLITPQHCIKLIEVVTQLNQLEDDYSPSPQKLAEVSYLQPDLFLSVLRLSHVQYVKSISPHLCLVFENFMRDETCFSSTINIIFQLIPTASQQELLSYLKILMMFSHSSKFEKEFNDEYAKILIDTVGAAHNFDFPELIYNAISLFPPNTLPPQAGQLISILLISSNESQIEQGLKLASNLDDHNEKEKEIKENIGPHVLYAFNEIIGKPALQHLSVEYLKQFPFVTFQKRTELLGILRTRLVSISDAVNNNKKVDPNDFPIIGALFTALAPTKARSQSTSVRMGRSESGDRHPVLKLPQTVIQQAPDFWRVVAEFFPFMLKMINADIRILTKHLRFLTMYPSLLDFRMRVNIFNEMQRQKLQRNGNRLEMRIRREYILADSYMKIHAMQRDKLLGSIKIKYNKEAGIDAGGLTRDWFTCLIKEIFNPNYVLFTPSSNERSFQPNPSSKVNNDHIQYFVFVGKVLARAMIEQINLDAHLTVSLIRQILGLEPSLRDLEDVDEPTYQSLKWLLDNKIDDLDLDMHFVADYDDLGRHITRELKPGGSNVLVTDRNKEEYVSLIVKHKLQDQIKDQVKGILDGFYTLIPLEEIQMFTPDEFDLVLCGVPQIDVDDMRANTNFDHPYNGSHPFVTKFFNVISKWSMEDLAKLLLFVTGSSQVPLGGFKAFKNKITIQGGGEKSRLPEAHTCFNQLCIPPYDTEDEIEKKLRFAIEECNSFGFG